MVDIAGAVRTVLSRLATPGLTFRSGATGTFAPFVGDARLAPDVAGEMGWDGDDQGEVAAQTATLKASDAATELRTGYQVQQTATVGGASRTRTFVVMGPPSFHRGKVVYRLKRTEPGTAGPNRGGVR